MAKNIGAWGIDIGQCALKALHCRMEGDKVVADAFDYIEYPKILSQPEADPETMIREALEQFLERNQITLDDRVAISVSGQSGLAKFFKPPPIDTKRIPDIVRYEARQQIPFPLEEVIWDYQKMAGGQEVEGFAIDAEVGLFAMKKEQVHRFLKPFERAGIALDIVQLAPLSIYNFISYDVLTDGPPEDMFDADDPPESIVVLSMGTDATDLVITNGFRLWQRSIPLGGNHFTKQLTKEMKLTFAKAEHLKRNARQAEDPKAVFQAMRPIFNDVVTEVQRSIGYFQGIDRKAKIKGVVLLGNTVKLPGLQQYVSKNLGYEVINFEKFNRLDGASVINAPAFTDNILAYAVPYGLCLQMLGQARLKTSLLPREILTRRMIKAKKPWAVASAAALLMACAFNFFFTYRVLSEVKADRQENGVAWDSAEKEVDAVKNLSGQHETTFSEKEKEIKFLEKVGEEVIGAADRRLTWLELMKTIDAALPWTENRVPGEYVDFKTLPLENRKELYIEYVESEYFPDLAAWWTADTQVKYFQLERELGSQGGAEGAATGIVPAANPAATPAPAAAVAPADGEGGATTAVAPATDTGTTATADSGLNLPGPTGPGWVIEVKGYHYFNSSIRTGGAVHVRQTLLNNLMNGSVVLPVDYGASEATFTMKEMGIQFPILAFDEGESRAVQVLNPDYEPPAGAATGSYPGDGGGIPGPGGGSGFGVPGLGGGSGAAGGTTASGEQAEGAKEEVPPFFTVRKYSFVVQFCWQEKRLSERMKAKEEEQKKLAEAAAAAAQAQSTNADANGAAPGATNPSAEAPATGVPATGVPATGEQNPNANTTNSGT